MGIFSADPYEEIAWQVATKSPIFRRKLAIGVIAVLALLVSFPFFFQTIEQHSGPVLHDWVLSSLVPRDVSTPIFLIIWSTGLLILIRARRSPVIFMTFIYSYVAVSLSRMVSINLVPLNPPVGLVPLIDPLSNAFYGKTFITKDLFYSGHTSTIFLMYLCLQRRGDRAFALIGSFTVGIMLLIQHVHYTIDVVAAPLLTYFFYRLSRPLALRGWTTSATARAQKASPSWK